MKYKFRYLKQNIRKPITVIITVVVIFISALFIKSSFSRYKSEVNLNVSSTSGNIKCSLTMEKASATENNMAYFIVKVTNSENNVLTKTDFDYRLKITNQNGSEGKYCIEDGDTIKYGSCANADATFVSSLTSNTYSFGTTSEETDFRVFVKAASGERETINYHVELEAYQKQV